MDHKILNHTEYWLYQQFGGRYKWTTFCHNGVMFPPEYTPHGVPIMFRDEQVFLEAKAEEAATLYARYIDTEYFKNGRFKRNFWKDWKEILGKDHKIDNIDDCNFDKIHAHLLKEKMEQKGLSKEEKLKIKEQKRLEEERYMAATVDGKQQLVGNFRMEPPGIFIGRGCHPLLGRIKRRIQPEDITLNMDKLCPVPEPPAGHMWGDIIHDRTVEWLASWKDTITNKNKYVWLAAQSEFKAESDKNKFDLARRLKKRIKGIRSKNEENMANSDLVIQQSATALYLIDNLALRVGNEKGVDEADTVGVSSLRVEHIDFLGAGMIKLDFLGKDSIRYVRKVKVCEQVYNNLERYVRGKSPSDDIFDKTSSANINDYLKSFMKELTAKVFRTFNASSLFQKELNKITKKFDTLEQADKINRFLDEFNRANLKVAILCNHRKKVSKSFNDQIDKINKQIRDIRGKVQKTTNKQRLDKYREQIKKLKVKKEMKIDLKSISLETSKVNYIDPRITVSFFKRHNLPIEKVFSSTLQKKFWWAFEVDENYQF